MSLTSSGSTYNTGTGSSTTSERAAFSLSFSPQHDRLMASFSQPPLLSSSPLSFSNRRGNIKFSSARYYQPPTRSLRGSKRGRGGLSSFRSTRRTAARPSRTKGVFECLLKGLTDGIAGVKDCVEDMKLKLQGTTTRVNYYMDFEKHLKQLERKVRTLEVHKDRIEEMRDEYLLKLKLREGAFNLAQALATQSSKASKEKLQEARAEQKDLLEDLCDIEDELETKLGVFKVHINGLVGVVKNSGMDLIETQLKLAAQKWKAKCRMTKHDQSWQDEDILFLGKVSDELLVKVIEVKKIQGNVHIGSIKCFTREFFSFFPMNVTFNFPSSSVKLNVDITWNPTLGSDFLADLELKTLHCMVGGAVTKSPSRVSSVGNVERLHNYPNDSLISGASADIRQIKIITESNDGDSESRSGDSYGRSEVKTEVAPRRRKKKKDDNDDFVFLDRRSIALDLDDAKKFPEARQLMRQETFPDPQKEAGYAQHRYEDDHTLSERTQELSLSTTSKQSSSQASSKDTGSLGSSHSSGSRRSSGSSLSRPNVHRQRTPDEQTLGGMLEAVFAVMEEPKELYPELRCLEDQLFRLESALKGGRLVRAPSMTLSESQAMEDFDFLGSDENVLLARFSKASFADVPEDFLERMASPMNPDNFFLGNKRRSLMICELGKLPSCEETAGENGLPGPGTGAEGGVAGSAAGHGGVAGGEGAGAGGRMRGSVGSEPVDRALVQHLIHCECLLQQLQSSGPLKYKLSSSLLKLQQEAEFILDLLNIAAEPDTPPQIEHIIPELAANDQLMKFWMSIAKPDRLSIKYERFALSLDERFGQTLWSDFPDVANKVFAEVLSRVLDLEMEDLEPGDSQMVVTVFQYAAYFLSRGGKSIQKCLQEVAQELKMTEGLESNDLSVKLKLVSQLPEYGYNKGAMLAAAHLLSESDARLKTAAGDYISKFAGNSPWHNKAVQFNIQLLEHSDQKVRMGASTALGKLGATEAVPQLRYLAKRDFTPVRLAATKALEALGESTMALTSSPMQARRRNSSRPNKKQHSAVNLLTPEAKRKQWKHKRTRSADLSLALDS